MHKRKLHIFKLFACVLLIIKAPARGAGRKTESGTKSFAVLLPTNTITIKEIATVTVTVIMLEYTSSVYFWR